MKHLPSLMNAGLCVLLIFILFAFGVPGMRVQAAQHAQETVTPTVVVTPTQAAQTVCDTTRTVQVSGTAVVKVVPDRVLIQLGIVSNAATISAVKLANTDATKKVFAALTALKIADQDISTNQYLITPIYKDYSSVEITSYRIHNQIAVTLRDISKTGELVEKVLQAGVNQIMDVNFYTSELRKYRDQARDMAVKAAQEKARALASGLGAEAGCVIHIAENTGVNYGSWYGRGQNVGMQQNVSQEAPPAAGSADSDVGDNGPVSDGQISVQAMVDVVFSLK